MDLDYSLEPGIKAWEPRLGALAATLRETWMYGKEKGETQPQGVRIPQKTSLQDQIAAQVRAKNQAKVRSLPDEVQEIIRLFEGRMVEEKYPDRDSLDARREAAEIAYQQSRDLWLPRKKGRQDDNPQAGHGPANLPKIGPGFIKPTSKKERDRARVKRAQVGLFPNEDSGGV